MTMLKNVISYSVESSSTTISSGSPTSATSTSPEGSSLLYEKANKGLGLAQDFMVEQTEEIQLVPQKVVVGPLKAKLDFLLVHFQVHFVLKIRVTFILKHIWHDVYRAKCLIHSYLLN